MTTHSVSRHCGRITFDLKGDIDQALSCIRCRDGIDLDPVTVVPFNGRGL